MRIEANGRAIPSAAALRELLLRRAGELGLLEGGRARAEVAFASREAEDAVIERVLEREVATPTPTDEECRRFYAAHPERFTSGELVEASHILFAVTPRVPVAALRERAQAVLAELLREPHSFAARARELSNCPSGEEGGRLGELAPGEMVPEFDRAVFGSRATGVLPEIVATRFGLHIVQVARRIAGNVLPYEAVAPRIAAYLCERVGERALRQYLQVIAGRAGVEGVALDLAQTPLVQ